MPVVLENSFPPFRRLVTSGLLALHIDRRQTEARTPHDTVSVGLLHSHTFAIAWRQLRIA